MPMKTYIFIINKAVQVLFSSQTKDLLDVIVQYRANHRNKFSPFKKYK